MCHRAFNKRIILLGLAGYEMNVTNTALRASLVIYALVKVNPCPSSKPEKNGDIGGQKPMSGNENSWTRFASSAAKFPSSSTAI